MIRDIFTNKWILSAIVFLFVLSLSCWLYYHNVSSEIEKEQLRLDQLMQRNMNRDSENNLTDDTQHIKIQTQVNEHKDKPNSDFDVLPDLTPQQEASHTKTRENLSNTAEKQDKVFVSPHGLGPYPEIPEGWNPKAFEGEMTIGQELIERVRIKMFNEGIYTYGGSRDAATGLVYPITRDRVYIRWGENVFPSLGRTRYAMLVRGHPDIVAEIKSNARARSSDLPEQLRPVTEDDIPEGVKVLSESGGIDPYDFLNLERQ